MSDETRGHALRRRRLELGIKSQRGLVYFAEEQGLEISRSAIRAAEKGEASKETYARYEVILDRLAQIRQAAEERGELDTLEDVYDEDESDVSIRGDMVEIHAKVGGDVDIIAKAPVASMSELKDAIADLIREARGKA